MSDKRIQVGKYTYETDLPVKIGDRVVLPSAAWRVETQGPTWKGTVTALESNYAGPCKRVLSICKETSDTAKPAEGDDQ